MCECECECECECVSILAGRRNALNPRSAARTISVHCAGNSSHTTNTYMCECVWVCVRVYFIYGHLYVCILYML